MLISPSATVTYTAISFAPVQGFIEKSRKLRDLYGASLILSHLSYKLIEAARARLGESCVISPGLLNIGQISEQEGMPNRILIKGEIDRPTVTKILLEAWGNLLHICRSWIVNHLGIPPEHYCWDQEWWLWQQFTWEIFWGHGETVKAANEDLEHRKLKRNWTGINWKGDSSSLTGTDAIAWHRLGEDSHPGEGLSLTKKAERDDFYRRLAWVLDNPDDRVGQFIPDDAEIEGKYIAANEKLSIPELVKRLVTYSAIADEIGMMRLDRGFTDINRKTGQWTGWFMGDGDKVSDKLKKLASDEERQTFSHAMRTWGKSFKDEFPPDLGRVIYAGGDDFLGVLYHPELDSTDLAIRALEWLQLLPTQWEKHGQDVTLSLGFVWAGHRVPQRDVLQHCREAEQQSKKVGRNRATIRIVFNNGQYIQWTCHWKYLYLLMAYRDRNGKTWGQNPNWSHLYSDWMYLKTRHAVRLKEPEENAEDAEVDALVIALFDLYFPEQSDFLHSSITRKNVIGDDHAIVVLRWMDSLIQVGWQLCSNT